MVLRPISKLGMIGILQRHSLGALCLSLGLWVLIRVTGNVVVALHYATDFFSDSVVCTGCRVHLVGGKGDFPALIIPLAFYMTVVVKNMVFHNSDNKAVAGLFSFWVERKVPEAHQNSQSSEPEPGSRNWQAKTGSRGILQPPYHKLITVNKLTAFSLFGSGLNP